MLQYHIYEVPRRILIRVLESININSIKFRANIDNMNKVGVICQISCQNCEGTHTEYTHLIFVRKYQKELQLPTPPNTPFRGENF